MNFIKIIKHIRGYLTVCIRGVDTSAFINLLIRNGINTWNVRKIDGDLYTEIFARDYRSVFVLRHLFHGNVSVSIVRRHGFFKYKKRARRRKGILVGIFLFVAIIFFLSRFVWQIDVKGNEKIKTSEIEAAYMSLGLRVGIAKSKIDTYALRDKLPLILRDVSWCSFNLEGSKLTVNITELTENKKKGDGYSNIIAKTDGIVTKINIIAGNKQVNVGDVVSKGDILVSGAPQLNTQKFVDSDAVIEAKTYKNISISVPKEVKNEISLNKISKRTVLEIFNFKLPLYLDDVHFENKSNLRVDSVRLFSKPLPIKKYKREFTQIKYYTKTLTSEEIDNMATAKLLNNLKQSGITYVEVLDITKHESKNSVNYSYKLVCREDICEKAEIKVSL